MSRNQKTHHPIDNIPSVEPAPPTGNPSEAAPSHPPVSGYGLAIMAMLQPPADPPPTTDDLAEP
jgi:hypothetical protein